MPMQVDHRIEWQVRPLGDEVSLDEPGNYELLDANSNSGSGIAIHTAIQAERQRIAVDTGDESWLFRDITFTEVNGGQSSGNRWSFEQIIAGEHLEVYERVHARNTTPRDFEDADELQMEMAGTEEQAHINLMVSDVESILRNLESRYPNNIDNLREIIVLRAIERSSWEVVRQNLGISVRQESRLRGILRSAGLHVDELIR